MRRFHSPEAIAAAIRVKRERARLVAQLRSEEAKKKLEIESGEAEPMTAKEEIESYDWFGRVARPSQRPPSGDWFVWMILAGRGFGKTRTGAEWVRNQVETGQSKRIALVGATAADVRDVMVEGPTGILSVCPPWDQPVYEPSKRRITWYPNPRLGRTEKAVAICYSADVPNRLRGPQHDAAWCDEVAAWDSSDAFDQLLMGLRLGANPRAVLTTTPRPTPFIRTLLKDSHVAVTRGSTFENSQNLAQATLRELIRRYEGTKIGRQELHGEVLEDLEGALWTTWILDRNRVDRAPEMMRIVVAVDPSGTSEGGAEQGIIVCGKGIDNEGYVLSDESCRETPLGWATAALQAYDRWHADAIVYEKNFGGEMVRTTIETAMRRERIFAPLIEVTASKSKYIRAEPVASLYEQNRIHHPKSAFQIGTGLLVDVDLARLEDQLCNWIPGEFSPDRLDAMVWGMTELLVEDFSLIEAPNPHANYRG